MKRALLLGTLVGILACSEDGQIARVRPVLQLSAQSLDFGVVPIGAVHRLRVTIKNVGTAKLSLGRLQTDVPFSFGTAPALIHAGESVELELSFRPNRLGAIQSRAIVESDDEDHPSFELSLSGEGAAGLLDVRPDVIELGDLALGTAAEGRFLITNRGEAQATAPLRTVAFDRPEHYAMDALPVFSEPAPISLAARGQEAFVLAYHPYAAGADHGRIILETCGPDCGLEIEVRATAHDSSLRLEPPAIDFGGVAIGSRSNRTVTVRNEGGETVELLALTLRHAAGASLVSSPVLPLALGPGQVTILSIDYEPTSAETLEGEFLLATTLPGGTELRVGLAGHGEGPLFEVQPPVLDFGTVARLGTSQRALLLANHGSGPVTVEGLRFEGDSAFSLAPESAALPARLEKGESILLSVRFTATTEGIATGNLVITSTDPKTPSTTVPLAAAYRERQCDVVLTPTRLDFGALLDSTPQSRSVLVQNVGIHPCTLASGAFRAPSHPDLQNSTSFPLTIQPGESAPIDFVLAPTAPGPKSGLFILVTEDQTEVGIVLLGLFGALCDGQSSNCGCLPGETKTYRSSDRPYSASGVFTPEEESHFHVYCEPSACEPGQVQVEVETGSYACSAPPASCGPGTGLDWLEGRFQCVSCEVVIRYGALYGGLRKCAPTPTVGGCSLGEVQTFVLELEEWHCQPTCDNGLYDQILLDGNLVCVPC